MPAGGFGQSGGWHVPYITAVPALGWSTWSSSRKADHLVKRPKKVVHSGVPTGTVSCSRDYLEKN